MWQIVHLTRFQQTIWSQIEDFTLTERSDGTDGVHLNVSLGEASNLGKGGKCSHRDFVIGSDSTPPPAPPPCPYIHTICIPKSFQEKIYVKSFGQDFWTHQA